MENITIGQIVTIMSMLATMSGFFYGIYKFIKKTVLDKIEANKQEIELLKKEMRHVKRDIEDSKEERLILLKRATCMLKRTKRTGL